MSAAETLQADCRLPHTGPTCRHADTRERFSAEKHTLRPPGGQLLGRRAVASRAPASAPPNRASVQPSRRTERASHSFLQLCFHPFSPASLISASPPSWSRIRVFQASFMPHTLSAKGRVPQQEVKDDGGPGLRAAPTAERRRPVGVFSAGPDEKKRAAVCNMSKPGSCTVRAQPFNLISQNALRNLRSPEPRHRLYSEQVKG